MDSYEKRLELLAQHPVKSDPGDCDEGLQSWRRAQVREWLAMRPEKAAEIMLEVWEAMDGEEWDMNTHFRVARAFEEAGLHMVAPCADPDEAPGAGEVTP